MSKEKPKITFASSLRKGLSKIKSISLDHEEPRYWLSTGNAAINRMISGNYYNGIPQGRIVSFAGPSGAGKSFIVGNVIKGGQDRQCINLVLDSEGAQSPDYLTKIGVDVDHEDFIYVSVGTVNDAASVLNTFIEEYISAYDDGETASYKDAPKIVIYIDSVDMLLIDAEDNNFRKGEIKADMGGKAKSAGNLLKIISNRIKKYNISVVCVQQCYKNQDPMNGEGKYVINAKSKYYSSFIVLLEKFKLKEGIDVTGFRMKASVEKSRFSKLGSKVEIEIPWDTGMNPLSGVLDLLIADNYIHSPTKGYYSWTAEGADAKKFRAADLSIDKFFEYVSEDTVHNVPAKIGDHEEHEESSLVDEAEDNQD